MMRVVLEDRISSGEIDQICTAYYYAMDEASRYYAGISGRNRISRRAVRAGLTQGLSSAS
jgi:hypothetical protein